MYGESRFVLGIEVVVEDYFFCIWIVRKEEVIVSCSVWLGGVKFYIVGFFLERICRCGFVFVVNGFRRFCLKFFVDDKFEFLVESIIEVFDLFVELIVAFVNFFYLLFICGLIVEIVGNGNWFYVNVFKVGYLKWIGLGSFFEVLDVKFENDFIVFEKIGMIRFLF